MAKAGNPVVLFSLETQALSVALRILSAETGVAMSSLRAPGRLRDVEIMPSGMDISVSGYVREPY